MAIPKNSSFGAGFDADNFRNVIKGSMQMGLPNSVKERPTFIWPQEVSVSNPSSTGKPYDFNTPAQSVNPVKEVQIDCAVEYIDRMPNGTAIGQFETPRVKITVMDVDYPRVEGATHVLLGGNKYTINFTAPPMGLFAVTVYQIHCQAEDES